MIAKLMGALSVAVALVSGGALGAAEKSTGASGAQSAASTKVWADVARWPDFNSGMWMLENPGALSRPSVAGAAGNPAAPVGGAPQRDPNAPPLGVALTPQAQARRAVLKRTESESTSCVPTGPLTMRILPVAFFYAGESIFLITDMDDFLVRRVIMNRKDHGDPDPTWAGHSIGHWEGDTLVIDTVALNSSTKLFGLPAGDKTHIVEHVRLLSPDQMEWRYTVTDPEILAQPWEIRGTYKRHRDWEVQASSCTEGNRDRRNDDGTAGVDLRPSN